MKGIIKFILVLNIFLCFFMCISVYAAVVIDYEIQATDGNHIYCLGNKDNNLDEYAAYPYHSIYVADMDMNNMINIYNGKYLDIQGVKNEFLYFNEFDNSEGPFSNGRFCVLNTNNGDIYEINNIPCSVNIYEDFIYYFNLYRGDYAEYDLNVANLDGSGKKLISKNSSLCYEIFNNKLYDIELSWSDKGILHRIVCSEVDGTSPKTIMDWTDEFSSVIGFNNEYVYFKDNNVSNGKVYKFNTATEMLSLADINRDYYKKYIIHNDNTTYYFKILLNDYFPSDILAEDKSICAISYDSISLINIVGKKIFYKENNNQQLYYKTIFKEESGPKHSIKVILNGKELSFEQPPYRAEDGSVMVPLRTAFEAMGASVYWNDQYKAAFVEYGSKGIIFTHDKLTFYIVSKNGNELSCHTETLDTPVVEHNGRTFIPLRNLAESIGCNVDWDNDTQTASVSIDINNKGKDFSTYEFEKINALYYAIVNTDPFKEYTDEIFSILKGRNVLVDSIAFSWTDITYGIKKFLGLSFDDESMYEEYSQMCLNKVLAKVPNGASETIDTDIITFLQDKVTDGVSIATEYFGASSTETKLLESTIDKMGKVIDWSAFTVEQIDKLMKDYGNNITYLKVLQDNCNDDEYLGIIYLLMGDYTDKWYRSVLDINNKLVDDAFDMGLDVGVGFYTVGLYPIADFAKDIVNKSIGLDKKTDAIVDLNSVCYLLPLFKNSYSSTRSNLMNDSSTFEEFRAAFEINKAADIFAYECIKDFASSKEDTDIADERYKALKNMSYILWKAQ